MIPHDSTNVIPLDRRPLSPAEETMWRAFLERNLARDDVTPEARRIMVNEARLWATIDAIRAELAKARAGRDGA